MESFGLEGTFKGHLVQPWATYVHCKQGHVQLDQVVQGPVQSDFEYSQGWALHHPSGPPTPGFYHPHCKKHLYLHVNGN